MPVVNPTQCAARVSVDCGNMFSRNNDGYNFSRNDWGSQLDREEATINKDRSEGEAIAMRTIKCLKDKNDWLSINERGDDKNRVVARGDKKSYGSHRSVTVVSKTIAASNDGNARSSNSSVVRQNEANEQQCRNVNRNDWRGIRNDRQGKANVSNSRDQDENDCAIETTGDLLDDCETRALRRYIARAGLIKTLRQPKPNAFEFKIDQPLVNNDGGKDNCGKTNDAFNLAGRNENYDGPNFNTDIHKRNLDGVFQNKSNKLNSNLKHNLTKKDIGNLVTEVRQLNLNKCELLPDNEARNGSWLDRFNSTFKTRFKSNWAHIENGNEDKLNSQILKKKLLFYRGLKEKIE